MWEVKWHMVILGIEGEKDWIERPRETEVLVRTYVLSFAEDRADNMLFTNVHKIKVGPAGRKTVIIRLPSLIDRDDILEKALKLKSGSQDCCEISEKNRLIITIL